MYRMHSAYIAYATKLCYPDSISSNNTELLQSVPLLFSNMLQCYILES